MKSVVIGTSSGASMEAVMAVYPRHKAVLDNFVARGEVIGAGPFTDRGNMAIFRSREAAEVFERPIPLESRLRTASGGISTGGTSTNRGGGGGHANGGSAAGGTNAGGSKTGGSSAGGTNAGGSSIAVPAVQIVGCTASTTSGIRFAWPGVQLIARVNGNQASITSPTGRLLRGCATQDHDGLAVRPEGRVRAAG
jgi:uncharacterized protein